MKRQSILCRILLPTIAALLLLPPLSCIIFRHTAENYAYQEAAQNLELLQEQIIPIMNQTLDPKAVSYSPVQNPERSGAIANLSEPVGNFLFQISSFMHKTDKTARLMIFASRMNLIYPRDEQERKALTPLALDFTQYIQEHRELCNGETTSLVGSDGQSYLVNIYEAPIQSAQVKYIIAYSAVSDIGAWIMDASILVLIISLVFAFLILVILWFVIQSITHPLHQLCRKAEQIGRGNFSEITPDFTLNELEDLRLAMNRMAQELRHSEDVQRAFFQNVSHELRNPLMSISGYAQGLEQGRFSSPEDAAHTILAESGRLTRLVNSLLTLSRMEGDTAPSSLHSVPIIDTIEDCLDRVNGIAMKKGTAISLLPFDESLCVYGEEELICKILENFLTNAIRYSHLAVTISVAVDKEQLILSVADDGDGISQKDLPHLFERCYKGNGGNFGIGLAIARSAAQKMGGVLSAANSESGGAVFTLQLKKV